MLRNRVHLHDRRFVVHQHYFLAGEDVTEYARNVRTLPELKFDAYFTHKFKIQFFSPNSHQNDVMLQKIAYICASKLCINY